jgi:hypothetical protein
VPEIEQADIGRGAARLCGAARLTYTMDQRLYNLSKSYFGWAATRYDIFYCMDK